LSLATIVAIADPGFAYLRKLGQVSEEVRFVVSDQLQVLLTACDDADAILYVNTPNLLRAVFPRASRLKWLHSLNTGVEPILFPELVMSRAILTNSRGTYKGPLAEFVMAAVLFFSKDIGRLLKNQALRLWQQFDPQEARGKVMGIVGYGETGRACAELARAHGMRILGLRRRPELSQDDPLLERVFGPEELSQMLPFCDYLVLSAPGTPQTRHLIGKSQIKVMKPEAVLINVGRGSLIDEAALIQALQEGRIRGAALDVFEVEPLPSDHPFYGLSNVLISPHATDHVPGWRERAVEDFLRNLDRFLTGQSLLNVVDKVAGY